MIKFYKLLDYLPLLLFALLQKYVLISYNDAFTNGFGYKTMDVVQCCQEGGI